MEQDKAQVDSVRQAGAESSLLGEKLLNLLRSERGGDQKRRLRGSRVARHQRSYPSVGGDAHSGPAIHKGDPSRVGHASTCGACTYCSLRGKVEKYPAEINYMTGDPRLVSAETPIQDLPSMQTRQLSRSTLDRKIVYKRKQLHV